MTDCTHGSYIAHGNGWICDRCGRVPFDPDNRYISDEQALERLGWARENAAAREAELAV